MTANFNPANARARLEEIYKDVQLWPRGQIDKGTFDNVGGWMKLIPGPRPLLYNGSTGLDMPLSTPVEE